MHGKKRDSDIHGLHRKKRRSDRSKRTSPRHIRAVHKLLVRDLLFLTDLLDDGNLCFTTGDSLDEAADTEAADAEAAEADAAEGDDEYSDFGDTDFTVKVYFEKLVVE